MEEDPEFLKLVQKSYILSKADNLEIPLVRTRVTPAHEAIAKVFLTSAIHVVTYGLDTVKTRSQSINPVEDVAHFKKNVTSKEPLYRGFLKGYVMVLLGNAFHLTIGKEYGYLAASVLQSIPKTFVEVSKINSQLCHSSTETGLLKIAYRNCLPYALIRDIILRSVILEGMKMYNKWHINDPAFIKDHNETQGLITVCIAATFLSNPFDVMVTKMASQRYIKYESPLQALKLVLKQEGFQKLFVSGSFPRLLTRVIEAVILKHTYTHMSELARDAF